METKTGWDIANIEKTREAMTTMKSVTDRVCYSFSIAVMLGVAEEYLHLLEISLQLLLFLGRTLQVLKENGVASGRIGR